MLSVIFLLMFALPARPKAHVEGGAAAPDDAPLPTEPVLKV